MLTRSSIVKGSRLRHVRIRNGNKKEATLITILRVERYVEQVESDHLVIKGEGQGKLEYI